MASLRAVAECMWVGASGFGAPVPPPNPFSVVRHFFGYRGDGYGLAGSPGTLSVNTQIGLVSGPHVHLNLIRVGVENFAGSNAAIDQSLELMRQIYAPVGYGVGRVMWFSISESDANDSLVFQSTMLWDAAAQPLTGAWTVLNNAIDVFLLLQFDPVPGGVIGRSPAPGSCDKDDACEMTGAVVSLESALTGQTLAHEVGHYLGLQHINGLEAQTVDIDQDGAIDPWVSPSTIANLMFPINTTTSNNLTAQQAAMMMLHCFTRSGC